jgi:hypothetical protein
MVLEYHLVSQASRLGKILLKGEESEILASGDEILLFLNQLQDSLGQNPNSKITLASFSDILYRFESEPEAALHDADIRTRLLNLFVKAAQ